MFAKLLILAASLELVADRPWVVDGDTVDFEGERIRNSNLDAPEIGSRSRCALERKLGLEARSYAIQLVKHGRDFQIYDRSHVDRFGRTVAKLNIDGRDFGTSMINAGKGRKWTGRTSNWCSS